MICSLVGRSDHLGQEDMASVVVLSSRVRLKVCVFFMSFFESPGFLERISTGVIVTFSME